MADREQVRLALVERVRRSGLPSPAVLSGYCRTAAALFGAPIAVITLVRADDVLLVGRQGVNLIAVEREGGPCSLTIRQEDSCLEIHNATEEFGPSANRLVREAPGIRFYAGAPFRVEGTAVGTIAVAAPDARHALPRELAALWELARLLGEECEGNLHSAAAALDDLRRARTAEVKAWFTYGLSHEYTNALTGTMAFLDTIGITSPDCTSALVTRVREAHARPAELTRDFIAFHEGLPVSARPLRLNRLVDVVLSLMQYVMTEGVEITVDLARRLDRVEVGTRGIEMALALLLVRARDTMEGEGAIHIVTGLERLGAGRQTGNVDLPQGDYATISVTHSGRALLEQERAALTGALQAAVDPDVEATYLWLAQEAVSSLGGQIDIAQENGGRTSLVLYLPVVSHAGEISAAGRKLHLLVVEDAGILVEALQSALERAGYQVTIATRAGEGLRIFSQSNQKAETPEIDLVIADVLIPGMNGIEMARRMRALRPDLPLIVISGQTDRAHLEPGDLPEGAVFLQKPFSVDILLQAVERLL